VYVYIHTHTYIYTHFVSFQQNIKYKFTLTSGHPPGCHVTMTINTSDHCRVKLKDVSHPFRGIDEGPGGGLQQAGAPVGGALEPGEQTRPSDLQNPVRRRHGGLVLRHSPEVSEGNLELQLLLRQRLHLLDEVLEGRLELVPHLALHLLGVQVVAVVHVLVFAEVRGDLPDLRVELDVRVAPLAEHDGVLEDKQMKRLDVRGGHLLFYKGAIFSRSSEIQEHLKIKCGHFMKHVK